MTCIIYIIWIKCLHIFTCLYVVIGVSRWSDVIFVVLNHLNQFTQQYSTLLAVYSDTVRSSKASFTFPCPTKCLKRRLHDDCLQLHHLYSFQPTANMDFVFIFYTVLALLCCTTASSLREIVSYTPCHLSLNRIAFTNLTLLNVSSQMPSRQNPLQSVKKSVDIFVIEKKCKRFSLFFHGHILTQNYHTHIHIFFSFFSHY